MKPRIIILWAILLASWMGANAQSKTLQEVDMANLPGMEDAVK